MFSNRSYCLTTLGFGLDVAPHIRKALLNSVSYQEHTVKEVPSSYLDDIYVNVDIISPLHIRAKLAQFGLICKTWNSWKMAPVYWTWMLEVSKEPCNGNAELRFNKTSHFFTYVEGL